MALFGSTDGAVVPIYQFARNYSPDRKLQADAGTTLTRMANIHSLLDEYDWLTDAHDAEPGMTLIDARDGAVEKRDIRRVEPGRNGEDAVIYTEGAWAIHAGYVNNEPLMCVE